MQTRKIGHMSADMTYIVYSISVDPCLQQQTGFSVEAMLSHVMESIHILLHTEDHKSSNSFRLLKDSKYFVISCVYIYDME